ncbi:hypothetical protein B0H16DRAFT_1734811 [Mycena metata]|uniref:Transposase family Tnp2 protein n=1 Tax=Mycena metata TaxID=1033252 RepID=A0AAD7MRX2_9AGAR|nr:hypothetical protein B0H16DRAFT_1734811 [Mycena metata]
MPRKIGPFPCGCGCGPVKTKTTEQRHLAKMGGTVYLRYFQVSPPSSLPGSPVHSDGEEQMLDVEFNNENLTLPEDISMDIDNDEPPGLTELSDSDSDSGWESDDGSFVGEDEDDGGWDSDDEQGLSGDWDEGDEPWQEGLSHSDRLGDIFEAEAARAAQNLSEEDLNDIRAFNFKADTQITDAAYNKLSLAFPQLGDLSSLSVLQRQMSFLSGVKPVKYDCCIGSCMCYTGNYAALQRCPFCHEPRFDADNKPRREYHYIPIIPRLVALYTNQKQSEVLQTYRVSEKPNLPDQRWPSHQGCHAQYRYFLVTEFRFFRHAEFVSEPDTVKDVFDGTHYKNLLRQLVTLYGKKVGHNSWPIIVFLYNLPPEIRFQLENAMWRAAQGVRAYDFYKDQVFSLHAYLILGFGDIPAIAKLLKMKGHNSQCPCRMCSIVGIQAPNNRLYVPLSRPEGESYDPLNLPLSSHNTLMAQGRLEYGIKGVPLLSTLPSISIPDSFPYDFMHLIWENVIKTLILLWSGEHKGMDEGSGSYHLGRTVLEAIGEACKASGDSIPSCFGPRVPNVNSERYYFIADTWSIWTISLAPVLLRQPFHDPIYYVHFVALVRLLNLCLQFEIPTQDINTIETRMASWVKEFERPYYQYDLARLPVGTLPIYGLLHIAPSIRIMGPTIKSRCYPWASIDRRILELAQLFQIKAIYSLSTVLDLRRRRGIEKSGTALTAYPPCVLVNPREWRVILPLIPSPLEHWGKIQWLDGGDMMHASEIGKHGTRDMTYVKFNNKYGHLQLLVVVKLEPSDMLQTTTTKIHLLAVVAPSVMTQKNRLDMPHTKGKFNALQVIDANDLQFAKSPKKLLHVGIIASDMHKGS